MASQLASSTQTHSSDDRPVYDDYRKGVKYLVETVANMKSIPSEFILPEQIYPVSASGYSIPVIDLKGIDGPVEQRRLIVDAIGSACEEWGFFQVINHGIETSLMEKMMREVEKFFALPLEEKMKYASNDVSDPVRYGTSLNTSEKHTRYWRDYLRHLGHPIENTFHLWPENPPTYKHVTKEYLEEMWKLLQKVAGAISESLGLEPSYIEKAFGEGSQVYVANYYPPCPEPHLTLGIAGHSDNNALGLLMQTDGVDGYQLKYKDNWIPIHVKPGAFVCNIGDCFEILSNGRYKSVEHRAVVNEEKLRISVGAGFGPALTATIAPAAPLVENESDLKYNPVVYKDYMRAQQISVVRGKTPLQAIMKKNAT